MSNVIVLMAVIACTAAYVLLTAAIPTLSVSDPLGPKAFPYVIAMGMAASALLLLVEILRQKGSSSDDAPAEGKEAPLTAAGKGKLLLAALMFGLYIVLLERLGFLVATALFLFSCSSLLNRSRLAVNLCVAVGVPLGLYLLLATFLGVPLPSGILPF